jgi:hypothetical protein
MRRVRSVGGASPMSASCTAESASRPRPWALPERGVKPRLKTLPSAPRAPIAAPVPNIMAAAGPSRPSTRMGPIASLTIRTGTPGSARSTASPWTSKSSSQSAPARLNPAPRSSPGSTPARSRASKTTRYSSATASCTVGAL